MPAEFHETLSFVGPDTAVAEIEVLLAKGADPGDGEFDPPSTKLVERKWPTLVDWSCDYIDSPKPDTVTFHSVWIYLS